MTETAFSVPDGVGDRFASLYTPLEGDAMALNAARTGGETLRLTDAAGNSPFEAATMHSGGGGLVGTIDDYIAFADMLRNGGMAGDTRLLGPRTLDFMTRNHLPGGVDLSQFAIGSFAETAYEGVGFGRLAPPRSTVA